jgi:hypothetical protein
VTDKLPGTPKQRKDPSGKAAEIDLDSSGDVVVEHHPAPPTSQPDKHIHPRLPLPMVPTAPSLPAKEVKNTENKKEGSD